MMHNVKIGEPINLNLTSRYFQFNRDVAIRDVFDALVELITNSDDSYHRLFKRQQHNKDGGSILIEIDAKRSIAPSIVIVRDRAEGMTLNDMISKLSDVGTKRSEEGDRGFMSRGAKDCTALGNLVYESIVDNKYYKAEITHNAKFIPLVNEQKVDNTLRDKLKIPRGNGTIVTLKIKKTHKLPRITTITTYLTYQYSLRDILDEKSPAEVLIRNYAASEKPQKIVYRQPEGELVCDEKHTVPGYPKAEFSIKIWKSPVLLEDSNPKCRKSGLIIKAKRAIHECSLLQPSFEKDDLAKHYFGRIECVYIDKLLNEYDEKREKNEEHSLENPSLLIDPNRQSGLNRDHPFTKALLELPTKKLKTLIDTDRSEIEKTKQEISSVGTKEKLKELSKAASKFFKQQVEDLEEISSDDDIDEEMFAKKGILIYPTYGNVIINTVRSFALYVNKKLYDKEGTEVTFLADSDAVEILSKKVVLEKHKTKSDLLYCRFKAKGIYLKEGVCIETRAEALPKAEALFSVIEDKIEEHEFLQDIEFEHKQYNIKEGSSKTLNLYAKYPELINKEKEIHVISENSNSLPIRGKCLLTPIEGTNFAKSEIKIESRRLVNKPITITAKLNGNTATTKVKIIQSEEKGSEIKIELCYEDFGNYRAVWGVLEGKPNLLRISGKHPSIKRYIGSPPEYKGQENIIFKTILAEIVAENVCRRVLEIETDKYSWKYNWADQKDDSTIFTSVFFQFLQRMRSFLPIAHSIMISEKDIKQQELYKD